MPDRLDHAMAELRRLLRRAVRVRIGWQFLTGLIVLFWVGLMLDRWLGPTPAVRCGGLLMLILGGLYWWFRHAVPLLKPWSDAQLAGLLARARSDAADVILAASSDTPRVATEETATRLHAESRQLANAALVSLEPAQLIRPPSQRAWARLGALAWCGTLLMGIVFPEQGELFLRRLALADTPWPKQVRLVPEGFQYAAATGDWVRNIARGSSVELSIRADLAEGRIPPRTLRIWSPQRNLSESFARVGIPQRSEVADEETLFQRYLLRLEGLAEDLELRVRGGDDRLTLRLLARNRPVVVGSHLVVTPPAYLGRGSRDVESAVVGPLVEGATAKLLLTASQPLAAARASWTLDGTEAIRLPVALGTENQLTITTPSLAGTGTLSVFLEDRMGIESAHSYDLSLRIVPDEPPSVTLRPNGIGALVTHNALATFLAIVKEDHALATLALRVEVLAGSQAEEGEVISIRIPLPVRGTPPHQVPAEVDLGSLVPTEGIATQTEPFALQPGDRLVVRAEAKDKYDLTERAPSVSEPLRLRVVTADALLAHLAERERQLRQSLEGTLADTRRLAYALEREARLGTGQRTGRQIDVRKISRSVLGIADQCETIRAEVTANRLNRPALLERLGEGVIAPLRGVADEELKLLAERLGHPMGDGEKAENLDRLALDAGERITTVLETMQASESYNELVATLRELIREQHRVNQQTQSERRERARRLLLE